MASVVSIRLGMSLSACLGAPLGKITASPLAGRTQPLQFPLLLHNPSPAAPVQAHAAPSADADRTSTTPTASPSARLVSRHLRTLAMAHPFGQSFASRTMAGHGSPHIHRLVENGAMPSIE